MGERSLSARHDSATGWFRAQPIAAGDGVHHPLADENHAHGGGPATTEDDDVDAADVSVPLLRHPFGSGVVLDGAEPFHHHPNEDDKTHAGSGRPAASLIACFQTQTPTKVKVNERTIFSSF